jgi:hypothetical protein
MAGSHIDAVGEGYSPPPHATASPAPPLGRLGVFAAVVYEATGSGAKLFLTDWQEVVKKQYQAVIEGPLVAQALLQFIGGTEEWQGTVSQLHDKLTPIVEDLKLANDRAWPRSAKGLGRRLRELQPVLKDLGPGE